MGRNLLKIVQVNFVMLFFLLNYFNYYHNRTKCVGANFAVALRQIYNRYLLQYEKSCSTNVNNEQWNEEEEEERLVIKDGDYFYILTFFMLQLEVVYFLCTPTTATIVTCFITSHHNSWTMLRRHREKFTTIPNFIVRYLVVFQMNFILLLTLPPF